MTYSIITSFNEKYWKDIAEENLVSLDQHWPLEHKIFCYHELKSLPTNFSNRIEWIDLYNNVPDLKLFVEKYKDDKRANGAKGFRTNAVKFVHKTFAIWDCYKKIKRGWLIWLDCDAYVYRQVNNEFLNSICKENTSISYLGRPGKYSECGFLAFNLDNHMTIKFLEEWENLYTSGDFIHLSENHDSWTFDYIRKKWNQEKLFNNLNKNAVTNKNPFSQSLIGPYIAHAKGKGKDKAREVFRVKRNI
jgi:hypothetical protein